MCLHSFNLPFSVESNGKAEITVALSLEYL